MERLAEEFKAIGFYLSGHPLDEYQSVLAETRRHALCRVRAASAGGLPAGRLAAIVVSARERRSQKGNKFAFAHVLRRDRPIRGGRSFPTRSRRPAICWTAGTPVLVSVEAERGDGDTLKLRAQAIEALDRAAAQVQTGLRLVLDRRLLQGGRIKLDGLKRMLKPGGQGGRGGGEIRLVLELDDRERELEFVLPGKYDISPMQRGLISTVPGVLEVQEV